MLFYSLLLLLLWGHGFSLPLLRVMPARGAMRYRSVHACCYDDGGHLMPSCVGITPVSLGLSRPLSASYFRWQQQVLYALVTGQWQGEEGGMPRRLLMMNILEDYWKFFAGMDIVHSRDEDWVWHKLDVSLARMLSVLYCWGFCHLYVMNDLNIWVIMSNVIIAYQEILKLPVWTPSNNPVLDECQYMLDIMILFQS